MKNMLNTLAKRSFAAGRVRNLVAVLAIMLTAILFTTVTTIGMGTMDSMTLTMQMLKGSRSDADLRYMTQEQFEALKDADFVKEAGLRMPVAFLDNTVRHTVELDVMDETEAEMMFCNPSHGNMPEEADEIVASDLAIRELGGEPEIGEKIDIEFTLRGEAYRMEMTVSGWYEAANDQMSTMVAGTSFADENPDLFRFTYDSDRETAGTYFSDIIVTSTLNLQETLNDWSRSAGGNPDDINAANYLPGIVNTVTNQQPEPSVIIMGGAFIVLFIFCGYLLIYNVFDISVMQDIRRYGLYRTIGMSRRQVKHLINRQAFWLSCIGIPLGLLIGFFVGKAALPVVMNTISVEYENIAVNVSPSPLIFLGAAVLTAFTVFLSTRRPVRAAANTPPIEAFHYVERPVRKSSHRKKRAGARGKSLRSVSDPKDRSFSGAGPARLAWSNLGRNRRRTVFIIISLMLCVVLLNSAGTAAVSLDVEKQVDYMIRTDFAVTNAASTNGTEGFYTRQQALNPQTIEDIASQPGVNGGSSIYKNTAEDTDVTYDFGLIPDADFYTNEESGVTFGASVGENGQYFWFGLGDDGRALCNVYGIGETVAERMDIQEGETDTRTLWDRMERGEGVLAGVAADRTDMSIMKELDLLEIGDMITVYKDGQPVMELPVLAKASINGDDEEIGFTVAGPAKVGGDGLYLYLPSDIYEEIYDEPAVYKYSFNVEESEMENMTAYLENYIDTEDPSINYLSAESAREDAEKTRTMIRFVGGLIGIIFGIAGVLNLSNTIVTTILTRRREFATMQSIGMTDRQLIKMMVFEGIFYAAGACAAGLILSVIFGFTLVRGLVEGIWYFTFRFTLLPALVTCVLLLIVGAVVPVIALKIFNRGSIVEKLRAAE